MCIFSIVIGSGSDESVQASSKVEFDTMLFKSPEEHPSSLMLLTTQMKSEREGENVTSLCALEPG